MKNKFYQKYIVICLCFLFAICLLLTKKSLAQSPPVMQWAIHLDNSNPPNTLGSSVDWALNIKRTRNGGYIACGYSNGDGTITGNQCALYRLDINGKLIWQKVYDLNNSSGFAHLNDVIETSTGYFAAVGYVGNGANNPGVMIITDKDGTQLNTNPTSFYVSGYPTGFSYTAPSNYKSIVEAPDGTFIIAGACKDNATGRINAVLIKTDGFTYPTWGTDDWTHTTGNSALWADFQKIEIVNVSGNSFDIVAAGNEEIQKILVPVTGIEIDNVGNQYGASLANQPTAIRSNIYATKVHYDGTAFSLVWENSYQNSVFPGTRAFNDYGPYTQNFPLPPSPCTETNINNLHSQILDDFMATSQYNITFDMIVSKNAAHDIIILAGKNFYIDQGLFNSHNGAGDCSRPCLGDASTNAYDDYRDGDAYLMRVNYSNGNLLNSSSSNHPPVQVAHFSGEDTKPHLREDGCNNLIITGTTSDNNLSAASLADFSPPYKAATLLCKFDQNFVKVWRRTVLSTGLSQNITVPNAICTTPISYDYECSFGLTLNPDNSIVICGNNGENSDDAYVIKLSSDNQANTTWNYNGYSTTTGSGSVNFPGNGTVNPLTFKGTLHVQSGSTLTIENCTLEFAETNELYDYDAAVTDPSGIVVEMGGKLIVKNATLRGLEQSLAGDCTSRDYMWDGITVKGDYSGALSAQGAVQLNDGGTGEVTVIQDAKVGVRCNTTTYYDHLEQHTTATEQWDHSWQSWQPTDLNGGGHVRAFPGVTFLNCRKSIEFSPYAHSFANTNVLQKTNFVCNGPMVDPTYTDINGTRLGNNTFCSLYGANRVLFQGCDFEGNSSFTDPTARGIGIATYDASYNVVDYSMDHNKFNNLYSGIVSGATSLTTHNILIKDAEFGMDHSGNGTGENVQSIYFSGTGIGTTVSNNWIKVPQLSDANIFPFGVQYDGCKSFSCYDNILHGDGSGNDNWGIIVASSDANNNIVYRNTLEDFKHGTTALYNNADNTRGIGLQFKCNTYKNSGPYYGNIEELSYSIIHPSTSISGNIRLNQGNCLAGNNPLRFSSPAGNTFINNCYLNSRVYRDVPALNIAYHINNTGTFPLYDPGSFSSGCISSGIATPNCNVGYNSGTPDPCPEPGISCSSCTTTIMQQMDAQISTMRALIDGGDTQAMLDFLGYGNATPEEVITELEDVGPYLSDKVLQAVIEHADSISNSGLKDIIIKNSPLSDSVYESLLFLKPVLAGNADVIYAQLAGISPRELLDIQIGQLQGEKRQMTLQLIEYYLTNDSLPQTDSATMLLAAAGYNMDAAGMLAFAGNLGDASTLLEGTQPSTQEELDEKSMMRIYLSLAQNEKPIDSIPEQQMDSIKTLAEGLGPAASQAKNVLHRLNQTDPIPEIPDYYRGISAARLSEPEKRHFIITNYFTFDEAQLAISPNPANTEISITYLFSTPATRPMFSICDITGKIMIEEVVNQYNNMQSVSTDNLPPGVYYTQLRDGSALLKSLPLVIIK